VKRITLQEMEELKKQLEQERNKRMEVEKEFELQVCFISKCSTSIEIETFQMSIKAEMEVAMKLLEKDIHEKQDTVISLRRQLDDIKFINLEMYKKLEVCIVKIEVCPPQTNSYCSTPAKTALNAPKDPKYHIGRNSTVYWEHL
jgi:hypothetical protein